MWLIANNLDFDRASTLPQVRFKILTVKDLCVGLSFSISRDGKCHILEWGMQVFNSTSSMHKDQIKNCLSRDVELGSLEQTVENQPKFFANSMKVQINLKPCEYFVILQTHLTRRIHIQGVPKKCSNKTK